MRIKPVKNAILFLCLLFSGCDILSSDHSTVSSPTAPTPVPSPTPAPIPSDPNLPKFIKGTDGMPVIGVEVTIVDKKFITDQNGQIQTQLAAESLVEARHTSFILRQTTYKNSLIFTLWPSDATDANYIQYLVYNNSTSAKLSRPTTEVIRPVLSAEINQDIESVSNIDRAGELIRTATQGKITIDQRSASAQALNVPLTINALDEAIVSSNAAAVAKITYVGNTIIRGEIVLKELRYARTTVLLHELGHILGLNHSIDVQDVMAPVVSSQRDFSNREKIVLTMLFLRLPGNQQPDNDVAMLSAFNNQSSLTRTRIIP